MAKPHPTGKKIIEIVYEYVKNNPGITAYEIKTGTGLKYKKVWSALPHLIKIKKMKFKVKYEQGKLVRRYYAI